MNSDSYLLVKFATRLNLVEAIDKLDHLTPVKSWDAVDGDLGLVIRVAGDYQPVLDALKEYDESLEARICQVTESSKISKTETAEGPASYIFVETEKERRRAVADAIGQLNDIEHCHLASGACDLVVVARSDSFQSLERLVRNRIRTLDGVLRIKQNRIISLSTL